MTITDLGVRQRSPASDPEAAQVWAALAPLLAARPSMRLWSAEHRFGEVRRLTTKCPSVPAAVPLYRRGRTRMLVFDLDSKRGGPQGVDRDRDRILGWIHSCGGRAVSDVSTSGGSHILVPLARATPVEEVRAVMTAAAARCPTLDITPMLNPSAGCISVPGSACREGGHRRLQGSLADAITTLTTPNPGELLPDLLSLLAVQATAASPPTTETTTYFTGTGVTTQLRPAYRRCTPLPAPVAAFARTAKLPTSGRWDTKSEARLAVLIHLMWRGYTLDEVRQHAHRGGMWPGLEICYRRYRHFPDRALIADWSAARAWLEQILPTVHSGTHKKHTSTGGSGWGDRSERHARWLVHAVWWCDITLRTHPSRWMVAAVLQALAVSGMRAGEVVNGVPVVAVGGRSLSVAAGLISESTVWSVLRMLRDYPGSPVLLVRHGTGLCADRYALTTPDVRDPAPHAPNRVQLCTVHPVWSAVGMHYRRVYELVESGTVSTIDHVRCDARMSRSGAYAAVAELARLGLLRRSAHRIELGPVSLDDLADRLGVAETRAERITGHQRARQEWRRWLDSRRVPRTEAPAHQRPLYGGVPRWDPLPTHELTDYLAAVMATGPPELQP